MQESPDCSPLRSKTYRVVTASIGIVFIVSAIVIVVSPDVSTQVGSLLAAIVIGALGVDALIGAIRDKRSLLSRIGPLP